jgi:hypothetical protein
VTAQLAFVLVVPVEDVAVLDGLVGESPHAAATAAAVAPIAPIAARRVSSASARRFPVPCLASTGFLHVGRLKAAPTY